MDQHMASLPGNYKSYIDPSQPMGYVPANVERTINAHMSSLPSHLKQYAGAYMQQRVIQPGLARPSTMPQAPRASGVPPPPVPDPRRLSHSAPVGEQPTAQLNPQEPGFITPPSDTSEPAPQPHVENFDFIMNAGQQPKSSLISLSFGNGSSMIKRIALLSGSLFGLLIIFIIFKSLIGGSSVNWTAFVSVAQDQQELIHLSGEALQQQGLSNLSQNLSATAQVSVSSSQSTMLQYLTENKKKVSTKEVGLKVSPTLDSQLTSAATNGDYDQVYQQIMQSQLTTYSSDLNSAYKTAGPKGRSLLTSDYKQARLMLNQLNSASSSS
jgi:hypothetical protein